MDLGVAVGRGGRDESWVRGRDGYGVVGSRGGVVSMCSI